MRQAVEVNYSIDWIPDELLLLIFNRIEDFKTLCRCCAVSKRFNALATQVDTVAVKATISSSSGDPLSTLIEVLIGRFVRLVSFLNRCLGPRVGDIRGLELLPLPSYSNVFKRFSEIRVLKIEFPSGYWAGFDDVFFKWKAEFGPDFREYVALAGNYCGPYFWYRKEVVHFIGKIAARFVNYGRASLLGILGEHSKLDTLVVTDTNGGGTLCMTRLRELIGSSKRSFRLNNWAHLADEVRLTNGHVLNGAVLAVVWQGGQSPPTSTCHLADIFSLSCDFEKLSESVSSLSF